MRRLGLILALLSSMAAAQPAIVTPCRVDGVGCPTAVPSQTGHTGKYLYTDGVTASWEAVVAGITGSGATGRLALWSSTSALTSNAGLTYSGGALSSTSFSGTFAALSYLEISGGGQYVYVRGGATGSHGGGLRLGRYNGIEWSSSTDGGAGPSEAFLTEESAGVLAITTTDPAAGVAPYGDLKLGSITAAAKVTAGRLNIDYTNTATVGAVEINKAAGRAIVAAGQTSVVVTNSLCISATEIFATVQANDASAYVKNVVPAAGSFTITLGAAATADTPVAFFLSGGTN